MRKPLLIAGLCLLLNQQYLSAQTTLNWGASFSPSWSHGALSRTANNINGNSISCTATVSMTGPGIFTQAMGSSGSQTPTVGGAVFTIPGASNRLQVTPNYHNKDSYTDIELSFTSTTTQVFFRIVDIDKSSANSDSYFDRVTITGSDGSSTFYPSISKYDAVTDPDFLVISGNTAHVNTNDGEGGNTDSDASDQRGTINVDFGAAAINNITIRYDNAPGTDNNPAAQSIAIGNISFTQIILPVTLTNFSGYRSSQHVMLEWTTRQEYNSAAYEIERSKDGSAWERIGIVAAAGFSNSDLHYSYRDLNVQGNLLLYRLKQVDIDNNFNYSNIVRIVSGIKYPGLQAYPIPFRGQVSIGLHSPVQQIIAVSLLDISGRIIKTEMKNVVAGENNFMLIAPGGLPVGVYQVIAYDASGGLMGKIKLLKE